MKIRLWLSAVPIGRVLLAVAVVALLPALPARAAPAVGGTRQKNIIGPPGSGQFGVSVTVLPNGNIVVADPLYDAGATADVGAVYLYDGATGVLISMLTGSTAGDQVGWNGLTADVKVLSNGNYVIRSRYWDNGTAADAGAVTWGNATTGISGVVSAANSLVGSTAGDYVGTGSVAALSNGNYVVSSDWWNNGAATSAGAVTWGNGTTGVKGAVSAANSLVGSWSNDVVGGVILLNNGNYVVRSPFWHNHTGAVTWGNAATGIVGQVSVTNSLVGSKDNDEIGWIVTALSNGNYVVGSESWDNGGVADAGAATWGNGTTGIVGQVSAANSLVGSVADDRVGELVWALSNGNYVVSTEWWNNGAATNAGAVTWGNGTIGVKGAVSAANSLVGSTADDGVGSLGGVVLLSNGNYVVGSYRWDNGGVADAGAATWGNGTTGIVGSVSAANSLVGSTAGDWVGQYVMVLTNGNYVVRSDWWDNGGIVNAGAATWGNGTTGTSGVVSACQQPGGQHGPRPCWFVRDGAEQRQLCGVQP